MKIMIISLMKIILITNVTAFNINKPPVPQISEKGNKKDLSSQYKLVAEKVNYCKSNIGKTQIHIRYKIRFENLSFDQVIIYPLAKKSAVNILIYKDIESLKRNKPDAGTNIFRVQSSLLKKPIEKMEADELYKYFTIIGPRASFEEYMDYEDVLESQEDSLQNEKSYYMQIHFETHIPSEIAELIKRQMKQFNPVVVESIMSDPVLIEVKEADKLQRCD